MADSAAAAAAAAAATLLVVGDFFRFAAAPSAEDLEVRRLFCERSLVFRMGAGAGAGAGGAFGCVVADTAAAVGAGLLGSVFSYTDDDAAFLARLVECKDGSLTLGGFKEKS